MGRRGKGGQGGRGEEVKGVSETHLHAIDTWHCLAAIHTPAVVVVARPVVGGAGQHPLGGGAPTDGIVDQGAAVVVQVLGLPIQGPPCLRVLDRLHATDTVSAVLQRQ